jgi:hypothetical protein
MEPTLMVTRRRKIQKEEEVDKREIQLGVVISSRRVLGVPREGGVVRITMVMNNLLILRKTLLLEKQLSRVMTSNRRDEQLEPVFEAHASLLTQKVPSQRVGFLRAMKMMVSNRKATVSKEEGRDLARADVLLQVPRRIKVVPAARLVPVYEENELNPKTCRIVSVAPADK